MPPGTAGVQVVAECLRNGGVVLLPTDTVYGLAVHPERPDAITRLFTLKGRPRSVNLPVMISAKSDVPALGGVISQAAERLMNSKYFPGPLTLAVGVAPKRLVPWLQGREEFAVRMPDTEWLLTVLKFTGPLLVTSANLHAQDIGESVPDILASLSGEPDLVIDDGTRATVPSTLVNCRLVPPVIERVGAVPAEKVEAILA
jgi:L-threonylcarbamoyladenylate synthase